MQKKMKFARDTRNQFINISIQCPHIIAANNFKLIFKTMLYDKKIYHIKYHQYNAITTFAYTK